MGHSVPRNKELMRVFKDLEMVEYPGSGIPRILQKYPRSVFTFTPNFIRIIFPFEMTLVTAK
jgi:predicted HTH transcriptional regulator